MHTNSGEEAFHVIVHRPVVWSQHSVFQLFTEGTVGKLFIDLPFSAFMDTYVPIKRLKGTFVGNWKAGIVLVSSFQPTQPQLPDFP